MFPISSQEQFSILDDYSEKTFLCGTAVSLQIYIFDGEAGKIGLEIRNLVVCTSFLMEQILVLSFPGSFYLEMLWRKKCDWKSLITGKIGLETRNLVVCTSFLVEQILVKAWLVDKDAEALRCQKLLEEEEEPA
ncbi:hypothetical protein Ddye_006945 [Dipteronia dyeriana]|uniref:Uncharacterized protein n=1 Tax=Dipteronia dyeriana TaxID=168575 RepID=A0AAD9XJC9_9ROSI|nr:hypothetical protein Ddye_006945 [Dipteronia dyeriana]